MHCNVPLAMLLAEFHHLSKSFVLKGGCWKMSNKGRRLDHIWITVDLLDQLGHYYILKDIRGWTRPSDHAPVVAELIL